MTKKATRVKTWYLSILLFIGLGLIFASCNSDDGGNPIAPQGGTQSDFIASQGKSDVWGAHYTEGNSSYYVNIPAKGDYQLEYAVKGGGSYFITFDTPEPAILEIGLLPGHILRYACITSGKIDVTKEAANTIKKSWKVTVHSITDQNGNGVPWWTPEVQTIFTADTDSKKCLIQDGKLIEGISPLTPPGKGGTTTGGTTPGPVPTVVPTAAPTVAPPGTYNVTVNFTGTCTTNATISCSATSGCTPSSLIGNGAAGTSGTFAVASGETATLGATGGCSPALSQTTFTTAGTATMTDNTPAATCAGIGGTVIGAECWLQAGLDETCTAACTNAGGTCDATAMATMNATKCQNVSTTVGGNNSTTWQNDTPLGANIGCYEWNPTPPDGNEGIWNDTGGSTCGGTYIADSGERRYCACTP